MAYNQNGQPSQNPYQPHLSPQQTPYPYGAYPPAQIPPQPVRRVPSFDTGDDSATRDERLHQAYNYSDPASNRSNSLVNMPNQEMYGGTPSLPARNNSGASATNSGYGYQTSPALAAGPTPHPAYNPQLYARSESQYSAQSYSSPSFSSQPTSAVSTGSYQPYIPSAYHTTVTAPLPNSDYHPPHEAPLGGYGSPVAYQPSYQAPVIPPPVPPRPYESLYSRRLSQSASAQYASQPPETPHRAPPPLPSVPGQSPNQSYPPAYTPPAPPPPPFSGNSIPYTSAPPPPVPVRQHTYSHSHSVSQSSIPPSSSRTSSLHHRLPSLPDYGGDGDYSTLHREPRSSTSPRPLSIRSHDSSPGSHPQQQSPQRTSTLNRHPQSRPLPGPPPQTSLPDIPSKSIEEDYFGNGLVDNSDEPFSYDDIMKELEAAVMGRTPTASTARRQQSPRAERINYQSPINEEEETQPLFSNTLASPNRGITPDTSHTHTNTSGANDLAIDINYAANSDESDAEAAAGLAAMRMAEEEDARRQSGSLPNHHLLVPQSSSGRQGLNHADVSSDSDVPVDMETYGGGGFQSTLNYGYGDTLQVQSHHGEQRPHSHGSAISGQVSDLSDGSQTPATTGDYFMGSDDAIHPFPSFGARTDTGGTGGLAEPSSHPRRLSFEDGDEATLVDTESIYERQPTTAGSSINRHVSRPLPRVPAGQNPEYFPRRPTSDEYGRPIYPVAPEEYEQVYSAGGTPVQKANSIGSITTTPIIIPPGRSITDAEQRRRYQQSTNSRTNTGYEGASDPPAKLNEIDLPSIPIGKRRKFLPGKLSPKDFERCSEPWSLSSVLAWITEMTEGEADLKEQLIVDGIVALFTFKVPTMNTADAEGLSARFVQSMYDSGALIKDEEWVRFGTGAMHGVLFQLTGAGCYSPRVHVNSSPGRCYSYHCMRTLKKIDLLTHALAPQRKVEDWATFYKLKKEDVDNRPKKEVERQNILHEIVTSEDYFMDQLDVLRILYRDGLVNSPHAIIAPKRLDGFLSEVFGKVNAVKQANEDYLLPQLKYRQEEQGPWIQGFSDIFREWIRKAKVAYTEYAANLPNALLVVRREAERNMLFRQFLEQVRDNERSKRLGWDTYLKAPITRLQRYSLLLSTALRNMVTESEEKHNLQTAIDEIKVVTLECDARVAEMTKRTDMTDLQTKLRLRPGMEKVQLNLGHLGRELIFQGDLQRKGTNKVTWLETHAILFDHYLILAKPLQQRDASGVVRQEIYDVSKLPIPMDLLVLETTDDDPVVKSAVKGITAVSAVTSRVPEVRTVSNQTGPGTLTHTVTSTSVASNSTTSSSKTMTTTTIIDSPNENVLFPFRIKHLGKTEVYVLYAHTAQNRQDWCDKIIEAKTRHATSLFAQNAEPFKLRVVADTAFGYDSLSAFGKTVVIRGTPLDRAVKEVEALYTSAGPRPGPVCRAQVNCATAFTQPSGAKKIAIGTDFGVYVSDYDNPRGWTKVIGQTRVTQIAVLEDFSVFLVISEKALIAYHLDSVCPSNNVPNPASESGRRAPQKLSGNRDVGFFATGRMKDRTLVFYKKKEGISSTFKVLEPVYHKSSTSSRNRFGVRKGTTEFFRDFDDFYIPSECYAINLFQTSLAVATARGIEVLTLDKKVPFSIPDLKPPEVASIAARIRDQKPLGMFRLSDNEFLLVFEEVAIYVDKHGDISRTVVMELVGHAKQAALHAGMYLVLVDTRGDFVEIRNAVNGRLRQVISGRDVKLLDDGMGGGTVKICMQHPEHERHQIVLEILLNTGTKE